MEKEKVIDKEKLLKDKAGFLTTNGAVFYLLGECYDFKTQKTVDEKLISIMLSDKPLKECEYFEQLRSFLKENPRSSFEVPNPKQNYGRLVFNRLCMYINSTFEDVEEERSALREKLRPYSAFINPTIMSDGVTFKTSVKEDLNGNIRLILRQL